MPACVTPRLLSLNQDELSETARQCYEIEVARRKLEPAALAIREAEEGGEIQEAEEGGKLVPVATFALLGEAKLAQSLLESAAIPSHLAGEFSGVYGTGMGGLRVLVPAPLLEQARQIMEAQVSDDDLSTQAAEAVDVPSDEKPPGPPPRRRFAMPVFLLVAVAATWLCLHWRPSRHLTEGNVVLVADFTNTIGNPVFDNALREGLKAQLEQSPFLKVLSAERIAVTLAQMTQPRDARLTDDLAREVCRRTASGAAIEGSLSSVGSQYALRLQAVNCDSGNLLAEEQVTANGKDQVLKAMGQAAANMRRKLGESRASVERHNAPPERVATGSLEALQAYSQGCQAQSVKHDYAAAIPKFQRAVSLDPNFTMAYARLGYSYFELGDFARAVESIRKAYELRQRVSENEKFLVTSLYETIYTYDIEAARKTLESRVQMYPRDNYPRLWLVRVYCGLGDYYKGSVAAQEALRINPGDGSVQESLASVYLYLNDLDDAKAAAQKAFNSGLADSSPVLVYEIAFLQHDQASMDKILATLVGWSSWDDQRLALEADTAAFAGLVASARELTRRAVDSAEQAADKETAAFYQAKAAMREALVGNTDLAKRLTEAALVRSNSRHVEPASALALALSGSSLEAKRLAGDLAERFPQDTSVQFGYLPMIRAAIALSDNTGGNAAQAIEALAPSAPYELGTALVLYPAYLRGEAYLKAHRGAAAAAEFRKILDHQGVVRNRPIYPLAYLGAGRAYALACDPARARAAY